MRVGSVLSAPAVVVALMASSESAFAQGPANATFLQCGTPETREQCAKIDIEPGHTRVLTFARSFKEVALGDPEIVDVQVKGDRTLLINAKQKVGTTTLILFDDTPMFSAEISVKPDVPEPDAPIPTVRVYRGGSNSSLQDHLTYECTSTGCALKSAGAPATPPDE
jgi:Flp pilus assembly secretin CpaC